MNTYFRPSTYIRIVTILMLAAVVGSSCGCSGSDEERIDATGLLVQDRRRHDPLHFSEMDLGQFTVTQRHNLSIFYIRFHLYAVVPDTLVEEFTERLQTHGERVRATVRETAQGCDLDQLNEPTLAWLKTELISSINREVQATVVRDVAFADFSFERG